MNFYSPNNFKNGRLIFNRYRIQDLILFCISLIFSILAVIITLNQFKLYHPVILVLEILPACVAFFLIQPLGVYHNFLLYGICAYQFFKRERNYKWEGICTYEIKKE